MTSPTNQRLTSRWEKLSSPGHRCVHWVIAVSDYLMCAPLPPSNLSLIMQEVSDQLWLLKVRMFIKADRRSNDTLSCCHCVDLCRPAASRNISDEFSPTDKHPLHPSERWSLLSGKEETRVSLVQEEKLMVYILFFSSENFSKWLEKIDRYDAFSLPSSLLRWLPVTGLFSSCSVRSLR